MFILSNIIEKKQLSEVFLFATQEICLSKTFQNINRKRPLAKWRAAIRHDTKHKYNPSEINIRHVDRLAR